MRFVFALALAAGCTSIDTFQPVITGVGGPDGALAALPLRLCDTPPPISQVSSAPQTISLVAAGSGFMNEVVDATGDFPRFLRPQAFLTGPATYGSKLALVTAPDRLTFALLDAQEQAPAKFVDGVYSLTVTNPDEAENGVPAHATLANAVEIAPCP